MYSFWKRQAPPPGMLLLDAPDRETCTSRRSRTNTPLQALALLNDPQYVEAARMMAQRVMIEAGPKTSDRIEYAFELATARKPTIEEVQVLNGVFERQLEEYESSLEKAKLFLALGDMPYDESLDACELAAWTIIASMILNLDETITKA